MASSSECKANIKLLIAVGLVCVAFEAQEIPPSMITSFLHAGIVRCWCVRGAWVCVFASVDHTPNVSMSGHIERSMSPSGQILGRNGKGMNMEDWWLQLRQHMSQRTAPKHYHAARLLTVFRLVVAHSAVLLLTFTNCNL